MCIKAYPNLAEPNLIPGIPYANRIQIFNRIFQFKTVKGKKCSGIAILIEL